MSRNPPRLNSHLSIVLPSPSTSTGPQPYTPVHPRPNPLHLHTSLSPHHSPAPTSPSPTHSTYSLRPCDDERAAGRPRGASLNVACAWGAPPPPPVPESEKRLPPPPNPHRKSERWALGAYDNKLVSRGLVPTVGTDPPASTSNDQVSSTLSHLPPIPPLSPSNTSSAASALSTLSSSSGPSSHPLVPTRPSFSNSSTVYLGDGPEIERSVAETMAHSSPKSPWSLLTVHVLPVFAGSPLKTPIEDINALCNTHILNASQRIPASRLVLVLTADLREFIAAGMLTLKAKFDNIDEGKLLLRTAEVWSFFYGQVLPYIEGVFLPFNQVRDVQPQATIPTSTSSSNTSAPAPIAPLPIPVRQLTLSGFLVHILLPLLPRVIALLNAPASPDLSLASPSPADLHRILQMALVLSTQARYSTFFHPRDPAEGGARDDETRESVGQLGKVVRWRMNALEGPADGAGAGAGAGPGATITTPQRASLQRAMSIDHAGRVRRRGWRASSALAPTSLDGAERPEAARQNSDWMQQPETRWGHPRDEDEDDPDAGDGTAYGASALGPSTVGTSTIGASTLGSSTLGSNTLGASTIGANTYRAEMRGGRV